MKSPKDLINDIGERYKLSDSEIARRVQSTQPTIWRLRTGATRDCMSGLRTRLEELHQDLQRAA